MRSEPSETAHTAPLLFRHATPRISSPELPGHYDPARQLWVIETEGGIVPVVEVAASPMIETNTSTRVRQESDDQDASKAVGLAVIEFAGTTVTLVQMEADDQDASTDIRGFDALLDTHTLTEVRQEADDTDVQIAADNLNASTARARFDALLDTSTLTKVRQETADDDLTSDETLTPWRRVGMLAELVTKTDVQQESDDQSTGATALELGTRLHNDQNGADKLIRAMLAGLQTSMRAAVEGDNDHLSMIH